MSKNHAKLEYIYSQFGNGDIEKGKNLLKDIAERLEHARNKHTKEEWDNFDALDAIEALLDEVKEVYDAYKEETPDRVHDELLDVIAVAVRMLNKEYGA